MPTMQSEYSKKRRNADMMYFYILTKPLHCS